MKLGFLRERVEPERTKIVLLVLDGLGGLPSEPLALANALRLQKYGA